MEDNYCIPIKSPFWNYNEVLGGAEAPPNFLDTLKKKKLRFSCIDGVA